MDTKYYFQTSLKNTLYSCFGKFCEDIKKRRSVKFATTADQIYRLASSPQFESCKLVSDSCLKVQLFKESIKLDRPIQLGVCILDVAKHEMFRSV